MSKNVLYSKPQQVCYLRASLIILAALSFSFKPIISLLFIAFSELLDMVDGYLARKTNSVSAFGTIADMLIDRLTPIFCFGMLMVLKPSLMLVWLLLLAADLLGHMAMLYCALLSPSVSHHKQLFVGVNPVLNLYYAEKGIKRSFMVLSIVFYDLALLALAFNFIWPAVLPTFWLALITMLGGIKVYIHLLHLYYSFNLSLSIHETH